MVAMRSCGDQSVYFPSTFGDDDLLQGMYHKFFCIHHRGSNDTQNRKEYNKTILYM